MPTAVQQECIPHFEFWSAASLLDSRSGQCDAVASHVYGAMSQRALDFWTGWRITSSKSGEGERCGALEFNH